MTITYVSGDPLLTRAQTLAFGANLAGRSENDPLAAALLYAYPAAFSTYRKQARQNRLTLGGVWSWNESRPRLAFLIVRETSVGITRSRAVEAAALLLARDYRLYGITSLALSPLGNAYEWSLLKPALERWLGASPLPVTMYETYLPGVAAEA